MTIFYKAKFNDDAWLRRLVITLCVVSFLTIAHSLHLPTKAWLSQALIAYSWKVTQNTKKPSQPWPWADTQTIAKMDIVRINKSMILLKGVDPTTLAFSAGVMHQYSTLNNDQPYVVAGHRDTHFSFLQEIQIQDVIKIEDINGNKQSYKVESVNIIDSEQSPLLLNISKPELILITCYPFNAIRAGGSLRYMVKAKRIEEDKLNQTSVG